MISIYLANHGDQKITDPRVAQRVDLRGKVAVEDLFQMEQVRQLIIMPRSPFCAYIRGKAIHCDPERVLRNGDVIEMRTGVLRWSPIYEAGKWMLTFSPINEQFDQDSDSAAQ